MSNRASNPEGSANRRRKAGQVGTAGAPWDAAVCEACGADNTAYPSDDAPPYLTIVIVGHVILPLAIWSYEGWLPSMWLNLAIWVALAVLMTLAMLPFVKGAVVGFAWATGVTRESARQ